MFKNGEKIQGKKVHLAKFMQQLLPKIRNPRHIVCTISLRYTQNALILSMQQYLQ